MSYKYILKFRNLNKGMIREFQKNIYLCFIDYAKAFDCVDYNKLESWETYMQVMKQQLELDMEQQTGSK